MLPDITVRNITGVAATFTGVLTYEDVTSVDSVGIVTARGGVELGAAGVGGTFSATGFGSLDNNVKTSRCWCRHSNIIRVMVQDYWSSCCWS